MKTYVLYNPYASNGKGLEKAAVHIDKLDKENTVLVDMTALETEADCTCEEIRDKSIPSDGKSRAESRGGRFGVYTSLFSQLNPLDQIIICGGDGTLNRFINDCGGNIPENAIYLYPVGTGNDFLLDIGKKGTKEPVLINKYLENLPCVYINGEKHFFINNISFGIDGWVCAEADRIKAKNPKAKINYTTIALKGLLGTYKPCRAKVKIYKKSCVPESETENSEFTESRLEADSESVAGENISLPSYLEAGKNRFAAEPENEEEFNGGDCMFGSGENVITEEYRDVWLAPSMNGRFIGGGMMAAPRQDRLSPKHTITLMLAFGKRLKIAPAFPTIFSGTHENNPQVRMYQAHEIEVEFDEPRDVQIDGEVIPQVKSYRAVKY